MSSPSVLRVNYKTLVAIAGIIVAVTLMLVLVDSMDARQEAARASRAKDEQIARRDAALTDAANQSKANGRQIDTLIAEVQNENALMQRESGIVSALRNELARRGISTIVENGKVRVVPGPVSTVGTGVGARGNAATPTSTRGKVTPIITRTVVVPGPTITKTVRVPVPAPVLPVPRLPILGGLLTSSASCTAMVCIHNTEGAA